MRKSIISEKNLVVVLFIIVLTVFAFAQENTKQMERMYFDATVSPASLSQTENPAMSAKSIEINKDINTTNQLR